jgi:hypothetical protein
MEDSTNSDVMWIVPFILKRAHETNTHLEGPADTEYGWGWSPTSTFWLGNRRVHLYYDIPFKCEVIEVSDVSTKQVQRAKYSDLEIAWEIARCFLVEGCAFAELPPLDWLTDGMDSDKFIPHPPSTSGLGNIRSLIDQMKQNGAQPWHPDTDPDEDQP